MGHTLYARCIYLGFDSEGSWGGVNQYHAADLQKVIKPQGKKGLYTYRRRVPADLKAVWKDGKPQGEVKVGLKTANKALALKAGAEANLAFEQKAKNIRRGLQDEAEKTALEKLEERK